MRTRKGKFVFQMRPTYITQRALRGVHDPALSADPRCGHACGDCPFSVHCSRSPWIALGSKSAWGESCLTPQGLPDGDLADPKGHYIPIEDVVTCDMFGVPLNSDIFDQSESAYWTLFAGDVDKTDPEQWPISALL